MVLVFNFTNRKVSREKKENKLVYSLLGEDKGIFWLPEAIIRNNSEYSGVTGLDFDVFLNVLTLRAIR